MDYALIIRPEAECDLAAAHAWYEARRQGLGDEFLLCAEATLARLQENPGLFPRVHREVRRALLRRFPYGVFYTVGERAVYVLAVWHCRRDPARWTEVAE